MSTDQPSTADIVVIGAGSAGISTAVAAAEAGLTVDLVEKQDHVGGMLHIAGGEFSGAGTRRQRATGIEDDPDAHFADVLRLSYGRIDRELARRSVQHQGETVDWLDAAGFAFHPDCPALVYGHEVYDRPRTYWGEAYGLSVLDVLSRQLETHLASGRVRLHLGVTMRQLHVEAGRVTGLDAEDENGARGFRAAAVVLATGGYDAAPQVRNRFLPESCHGVLVGCLDHATGDGLLAAEAVGAAVSQDGIFLPVTGLIPDPDRPGHALDYREASVELAPALRTPYEIWVNQRGERFVAEDTPSPEERERALLRQPDNTMYVVFDSEAVRSAPVSLFQNPAGEWSPERFRSTCDDSPLVTRASTLSELSERMAVSSDALARTIADYNAEADRAATAGHADRFGRRIFPTRLEKGPWYAVRTMAASLLSRDGLQVDVTLRVLDARGAAIPGLYAVGEVLGNNKFAGANYVGGMSITPALTLGRLLGADLADQVDS